MNLSEIWNSILAWSPIIWLVAIVICSIAFGYRFLIGFVVGIFYLVYLILNNDMINGLLTRKVDAKKMLDDMVNKK
jgi:hypothetical protein